MKCRELVDDIFKEGAHYNFTKMHVMSHDAEQIPKFGRFSPHSTEISECMHKGLKAGYRRSNKVQLTSQIVTHYTRDHTVIIKYLTIRACTQQARDPTASVGKRPKDLEMYSRLQGKMDYATVCNLRDLEQATGVCDITLAMITFLRQEIRDDIDEAKLLSWEVRGYQALKIPVPKFNGEGFVIHNARCTEQKAFRGGRGTID